MGRDKQLAQPITIEVAFELHDPGVERRIQPEVDRIHCALSPAPAVDKAQGCTEAPAFVSLTSAKAIGQGAHTTQASKAFEPARCAREEDPGSRSAAAGLARRRANDPSGRAGAQRVADVAGTRAAAVGLVGVVVTSSDEHVVTRTQRTVVVFVRDAVTVEVGVALVRDTVAVEVPRWKSTEQSLRQPVERGAFRRSARANRTVGTAFEAGFHTAVTVGVAITAVRDSVPVDVSKLRRLGGRASVRNSGASVAAVTESVSVSVLLVSVRGLWTVVDRGVDLILVGIDDELESSHRLTGFERCRRRDVPRVRRKRPSKELADRLTEQGRAAQDLRHVG
ncbi:MAG: hypothetical protein R3B99_32990 [Polyangiales bacterium]